MSFTRNSDNKAKFLEQQSECYKGIQIQSNIFILVNSHSGSWHGKQLVKKFNEPMAIRNKNMKFNLRIYDLYSAKQRDNCFQQINQLSCLGEDVKIIISGGDGTVEWVISESIMHKVNFQRVVFGVLPLGTGNDFASSIGWEDFKFWPSLKKIYELLQKIGKSQVQHYDIWQCKIECFKTGLITEIKNGEQKILQQKHLQKSFTNYFGVGTDAQITYLAQKINAKTIFLKKFSYTLAWMRSFCVNTGKLLKKIKKFTYKGTQNPVNIRKSKSKKNQLQLSNDYIRNIENTQQKQPSINLDKNDACITFLNSTFSMELSNIWKTPYSVDPCKKYRNESTDDGMIELVSYRNQFSILLERVFHMAKKLAQGEGPFKIEFKQPEPNKIQQVYVHINGQPYKLINPKIIQIGKSKQVPNGKIRVLQYKQ